MKLRVFGVMMAMAGLTACGGGDGAAASGEAGGGKSRNVNVYNWSDYIAPDTNADFEKATGIAVTYDVFDGNEVLEAKLLAGSSGYDVVVPTLNFLGRQIQAGVFQPLDKARIPNLANLDPQMMQKIAKQDPGNQYAVPYMWGTTGIGYNVDKVKAAFGNTEVTNSWDLVFKPENLAKLKDCGVTFLDTPSELIPIALNYLGEDPNSTDPQVIDKAGALLKTIRPYIGQFHSSAYIDALANGDTCLVVGWSGDVIQARERAAEAGNGVHIAYSIPKEGAPLWFDMLAIPKDARNVDNAYAYINYLLDPKVMASDSDFVRYPNAVPEAKALMDKAITSDPTIYPPPEVEAKLFTFAIIPPEVDKQYTRLWTDLKTGR
ncbi:MULTISPECIES: polyamine ABC transporter substrate-binding protein [Pseudoxanthomonas]|uniref:Putrescine-binding periplasmic protein n=1 Tax=Pseudoxanthomonas winnipegensis TaxID=2480810 RepID=A0AAW8G987_9GAMM|nr:MULTISPECIES: polyamine ABC transporter substrate-binding protein [Pseudoxanthomonas]MDQ1118715.1 putrescine transport system substrate-binding protein [Pseudoxanthomonas winnipegensis]MDQ1131902.1 putrescine transport system substrate-binding protein [Pseudoxanthomonas winnipegensis]MDR6138081.1 putrescine transport system substrate-binding protein [Pseudoxanthomonas sp. SORGH_AS_0997]